VQARALDFCDAIAPGPHIGSAVIPAALAAAELRGGCSGREFLAALVVGTELAVRLNLSEAAYDGFDPTGICVPFAAAAAASRLLGLDEVQTWNALGAVFNRCGGSFQSHIDGSLGVRVNQGWVAHDGVVAARFARLGISGPRNFLTGVYGYLHLYAKGQFTPAALLADLGRDYRLDAIVFKKYPSCALTASPTEAIRRILADHRLDPEHVAQVDVVLPPYAHKLVGHPFKVGDNPAVDGQFSVQYCIANVLLRGTAQLADFTADAVREPRIPDYAARVHVHADAALERRGHTATDLTVTLHDGVRYRQAIDIAPGFPGNPLDEAEHLQRFMACIEYAASRRRAVHGTALAACVSGLAELDDVRVLLPLLDGTSAAA
jgi:2-methylcitrate dehydratase PrpD